MSWGKTPSSYSKNGDFVGLENAFCLVDPGLRLHGADPLDLERISKRRRVELADDIAGPDAAPLREDREDRRRWGGSG